MIMANEVLDHLLKVESDAAAMVSGAQAEADRRIRENEENNRTGWEERFKAEIHTREAVLENEKEKVKQKYNEALEEYRREISAHKTDVKKFCDLVNSILINNGDG